MRAKRKSIVLGEKTRLPASWSKGLTVRQRAFLLAVVQHGNARRAYAEAGYAMSKHMVERRSKALMKHPKIEGTLNSILQARFPMFDQRGAHVFDELLKAAEDPATPIKTRLDIMKQLSELRGWNSAKKTTTMKVNAADFLKPPSE